MKYGGTESFENHQVQDNGRRDLKRTYEISSLWKSLAKLLMQRICHVVSHARLKVRDKDKEFLLKDLRL